jgi:hypothetical protein
MLRVMRFYRPRGAEFWQLFMYNILMIAANGGGVGIPLYWRLLDNKSGNSAYARPLRPTRKDNWYTGVERIGSIVDR